MRAKHYLHIFLLGCFALLLNACQSDEARVAELFAKAQQHHEKQEIRTSVIKLKELLQIAPQHAQARWLLGKNYLLQGDASSAEKELRLAAKYKNDDNIKIDLVRAHFLLQQFEESITLIDSITDPKLKEQAQILKAEAYLNLQKFDEAKQLFSQVFTQPENASQAHYGLALLALMERDSNKAEAQLEYALQQNPKNYLAYKKLGELYLYKREFKQAIKAFENSMQHAQNWQKNLLRMELARTYLAMNDLDAAEKILGQIDKKFAAHPTAQYQKALIALRRGKHDEAEQTVLKVLAKYPKHYQSMLLLGILKYGKGELEQAQDNFQKFIQANPQNLYARKLLANLLLKRKNASAVIDLFSNIKSANSDFQINALLGSAYLMLGKTETANQYYEQATKLAPDNQTLRTFLAVSQFASGDVDTAVTELENIIEIDPNTLRADILLIQIHLRQHQYEKAIKAAQEFIKNKPDSPIAHTLLGTAYAGNQQYKAAYGEFAKANQINPEYLPAILNLAKLELKDHKDAAAKQRLQKALQKNPGNETLHVTLAKIAILEKDKATVEKQLREAIDKNPQALESRLLLGAYYLAEHKLNEATTLAKEAYKINNKLPQVVRFYSQIQNRLGNYAESEKLLQELARLSPDTPAVYVELASVQLRTNKRDDARDSLQTALKLSQNKHAVATMLLGRLDVAENKLAAATQRASQLQKQFPELPGGLVLQGDVYMARSDAKAAIQAYLKAKKINEYPDLVLRLHNAYLKYGDEKSAINILKNWLQKNPADIQSRIALATTYERTKNSAAAQKEYEAVIEHAPNHPVALNNLAWMYFQQKNPKALALAERALQSAPNSAAILDTVGWIQVQSDQRENGIRLLRKAVQLAPNNKEIKQHLDTALAKQ